jgi:tetratricopeptide (TPR) repeat protein
VAIKSYAKKEFASTNSKNMALASWHDQKEVREVHQRLMKFYTHKQIRGVNGSFESCYHKIMLREGFEREFEVSRGEFAQNIILGSILLNNDRKIKRCQDIDSLPNNDIQKMIENYKDEEKHILSQMSQEFFEAIRKHLSKGKNSDGIYDIDFLEALMKRERFKRDDSVYYVLGIAYGKKGEYDKAITSYKKAIEINTIHDEAYNNMGIAYRNKGEYDKAIASYEKAIKINPEKDEAYYNNMGIVYSNKGKYDKAIASYEKAIEINPEKDEAYNNMGFSYANKGEYDKAITSYKKAIEINPKKDEAYNNMGSAYYEKGEYDKAIASYKKAIEINPKYDSAYNNMGVAYAKQKNPEQVFEAWQKVFELNPKGLNWSQKFSLWLWKKLK